MTSTMVVEEQRIVLELILPEDMYRAHPPSGYVVTSTKVMERTMNSPRAGTIVVPKRVEEQLPANAMSRNKLSR